MTTTVRTLTIITALGCGTMAGVFFAFSAFVMAGLRRLPPAEGTAAMQSINITAVRPAFMTLFVGTAALCVVLGVRAATTWGDRTAVLLLVGALLYLVGCLGLTGGYHVPRNDALATLDPHGAGTATEWAEYLADWTRWNHVRTAASLGASTAFLLAALA